MDIQNTFDIRPLLTRSLSVSVFFGSLAIVYLSMRAVLNIGGYCAEGGPYEISVHCPEGIPCLMPLSIFGMIGSFFVYMGSKSISGFNFSWLFWPAIFTSLGWNFIDFGLNPPDDSKLVLSWLFCGVIFILMGLGPIYLVKDQLNAYIRSKPKFSTGTLAIDGIQLVTLCIGISAGALLFKIFT